MTYSVFGGTLKALLNQSVKMLMMMFQVLGHAFVCYVFRRPHCVPVGLAEHEPASVPTARSLRHGEERRVCSTERDDDHVGV